MKKLTLLAVFGWMLLVASKCNDKASGGAETAEEATNDTISTATGLKYIIWKKGDGDQAEAGDKVSVHYAGRLLDGSPFDDSYKRGQPFSFPLGGGRVIKGWDEGIAYMNVGDSATLIIPAELGYGAFCNSCGSCDQSRPPFFIPCHCLAALDTDGFAPVPGALIKWFRSTAGPSTRPRALASCTAGT